MNEGKYITEYYLTLRRWNESLLQKQDANHDRFVNQLSIQPLLILREHY